MIHIDENITQEDVEEGQFDHLGVEDFVEFVLQQLPLQSLCNLVN